MRGTSEQMGNLCSSKYNYGCALSRVYVHPPVILPSVSLSSDHPTLASVSFLADGRRRAVRRSAKVWSPVSFVQGTCDKDAIGDIFCSCTSISFVGLHVPFIDSEAEAQL